jgi:hypothetical protein
VRTLRAAVIGLVVISSVGRGQRGSDEKAARQFVESFYSWYTPRANADLKYPSWWIILTSRPGALDDRLAAVLRADSAAQRGVGEPTREVINFDPFLYSQDPCPRYEPLQARREKGLYLVEVRPRCADTTWQTQRPVVAVSRSAGEWKIVNVFYEKSDLMGLLCEFARADKKPQPLPRGC